MKVKGDLPPSAAFTIEEQPNKPGFSAVRFYENAEPFREEGNGEEVIGWRYDEYRLLLPSSDTLEEDIEENYSRYIVRAKGEEAARDTPTESEKLRADVDFLAAMTGVVL